MQYEDVVAIVTIEHPAWRFDDLTIAGAPEFLRTAAAVRVIGKLLDVAENALDHLRSRNRIFQCDVVGDRIQVAPAAAFNTAGAVSGFVEIAY